MSCELRLGHLEVFVTDPERSKAFYRDVLEFEVIAEQGVYTWYRVGTQELLSRPVKVAGPGVRHGAPGFFPVLYTDDLEATAQRLRAKGVIFGPPDGDDHCLTFADPDGNWFQLVDPADHQQTTPPL